MPLRQGTEQALQRLTRILAGPLRPQAHDVVDRREVLAAPRAALVQHDQKDRRGEQRPRGFRPVARLRIALPGDERTGDGIRGLLSPRQIPPVREPIDHFQWIERVGMLGVQQKHPVPATLQLVARQLDELTLHIGHDNGLRPRFPVIRPIRQQINCRDQQRS